MKGYRVKLGGSVCFIDGPDATAQSAKINGRVWYWDFDTYCGPLFTRKDGTPLKNQMPPQAVWDAFEKWFSEWKSKGAKP